MTDQDETDSSSNTTLDDRVKSALDAFLPKMVWYPLYLITYVPIVFITMFTYGFCLEMYNAYPRKFLVFAAIVLTSFGALLSNGTRVKHVLMGWMMLYIIAYGIKEYGERGGGGGGGGRTVTWWIWHSR